MHMQHIRARSCPVGMAKPRKSGQVREATCPAVAKPSAIAGHVDKICTKYTLLQT